MRRNLKIMLLHLISMAWLFPFHIWLCIYISGPFQLIIIFLIEDFFLSAFAININGINVLHSRNEIRKHSRLISTSVCFPNRKSLKSASLLDEHVTRIPNTMWIDVNRTCFTHTHTHTRVRHTGSLYFRVTRVRPGCFRRVRCIVVAPRLPYVQHGRTSSGTSTPSMEQPGLFRSLSPRSANRYRFLLSFHRGKSHGESVEKNLQPSPLDRLTRKSYTRNLLSRVTLLSVASACPRSFHLYYIADTSPDLRPDVPVSLSLFLG